MNEKLASTSVVRRLKRLKDAKLLPKESGYSFLGVDGPKLRAHMKGRVAARDLAKLEADTSGNLLERFIRKQEIKKRKKLLRNKNSGLRQFMRAKTGTYDFSTDTFRKK